MYPTNCLIQPLHPLLHHISFGEGTKKQNKTKQNKTKQNKTKQNKTKQNKTKQNILEGKASNVTAGQSVILLFTVSIITAPAGRVIPPQFSHAICDTVIFDPGSNIPEMNINIKLCNNKIK